MTTLPLLTPSSTPGGPTAAPADGLALSAERIVKRWTRREAPVLDGVDLALSGGEAGCLTGGNGAGKTTLLRIAAGLIAPDSGTVTVHGISPERRRRDYQRRIGFLSTGGAGLYARMSARRHLALWARMCLLSSTETDRSIAVAIERFELEGLISKRVDRLSTGQRQRVRLAMTFQHEPDLVLLDEPRNGLDDEGTELLARALRDLLARGGAVLWAVPGLRDAPFEFDRVFVIEDGSLAEAAR